MGHELTPEGFVNVRYQELREGVSKDYKDSLGNDIKTDRSSILGQLISIDTQAESELGGLIQELLTAFNPYQASGNLLSNIAVIMGTKRLAGTQSLADIQVTLSRVTTIPEGFTVKNADGHKFKTTQPHHLPAGIHTIQLQSVEYGQFPSQAGTITSITTPVFGVTAISNQNPSVDGNKRETDAELRQRLVSNRNVSSQTITGVNSALSTVQGIGKFKVIENRTDVDFPNGQKQHSLFIIAEGGLNEDIAEALIDRGVPAGIDYSLPTGVTPVQAGFVSPVNPSVVYNAVFARPLQIEMFAEITITTLPGYSNDDEAKIRQSVTDWYEHVNHIGGIIHSSELYCPVTDATNLIQSILSINIGDNIGNLNTSYDLGHVGQVNMPTQNVTVTIST